MAGHTKGPRGKRPPPTASYVSTICMVVFVVFCLLGVWMLTSSSIVPSQATTTTTSSSSSRLARAGSKPIARHPPPAGFDEDLATDGAKGEQVAEEDEKPQPRRGEGKHEQQRGQQQEEEEPIRRSDEEMRHRESQESHGGDGGMDEHVLDGGVDEETRKHSEQQQSDGQNVDDHENSQEEQAAGENSDEMIQHQRQEGVSQAQAEHDGETEALVQSENDAESQQQEGENGGSNSSNEEDQQQNEEDQQQNEESQQQNEESQQQNEEDQQQNGESQQQNEESQQQNGESQQQNEESQQQNEEKLEDPNAGESLTDGERQEVLNESDGNKRSWATQADQSDSEKERRRDEERFQSNEGGEDIQNLRQYNWELCNVTAGADYIPCLDNTKAIKKLHSFRHYEHRERHCPEESPVCLVPLPTGYRRPIEWPKSRDKIWYNNIPHTKLVEVKGHQNWVKVEGDYLVFPGGGTQFIHGALHYIDFIQQSVRDIAWGRRTRIILDVGCGVASFGGYLFERDVLAMSFAPKDEHEAQVQFALERGIPAISAVMGSQRLPFPGRVFDLVHCARCRVPWHADSGTLLLELNRVLRPGGYFVWSATPVYQKLKEDVEIWKAMKSLTTSMCWDLITIKKDRLNGVAAAIYRKPTSNECYENRKHHSPPMCNEDDDPNAAWYIPLKACMHGVPEDPSERGSQWPERWPRRVAVAPYWLNTSQVGVYGKPSPDDFRSDYEHWKRVLAKSYLSGLGINWSKVRNVMDMRAVYGGFAAALKDIKVWVMNVVNIDAPDTLPIIYERGLMGIYHDWCQSFSTYPRTYDLLHADHLFSQLKNRCDIVPVIVEVDRILRPGGKLIVRDETAVVSEVENLLKSLQWEIRLTYSKDQEAILCADKTEWRPEKYADSS